MGLDMFLRNGTGKDLGYWRKANAVHGYIVTHFADGVDKCQRIRLTRENLAQLRKDCLTVLADRKEALKLLPPTPGFFFGSYDIDQWYFDDLKDTVKIIDNALATKSRVFIYNASW